MPQKYPLETFRHSLAHVLASAVLEMFPETKFGIGPSIDSGFYYDFELPRTLIPEDLPLLQEKMERIIKENHPFEKKSVSIDEAVAFFKKANQTYKIDLLEELKKQNVTEVSLYKSGNFVDLCKGPHVESTGEIGQNIFKLDKTAGAYWRGSEKNKMLQRIYGLAFASGKELRIFENGRAEAIKRDHRKIGPALKLFAFSEFGPGFPIFLSNGLIIWNELLKYWKEVHAKFGYQEIKTPLLFNKSLWETSGHWSYYRENMYTSKIEDQEYVIKPMNCPGGILVYKNENHSYREFPLKMAEIGLVHRHEKSGVLGGLFRVRAFHQDDSHIFMTEEQVKDQILEVIKIVNEIYTTFGLKYHFELSTRPKKSIGTAEAWEMSTAKLKTALEETGQKFKINEGDGAFYGPKIDVHLEDSLGRTWQCATIQLDMNLPERFDLHYITAEGTKKRPIMVHRVIFGSIERFFGILVEHFAGAFPLWLSPVQLKIVTVSDKFASAAAELKEKITTAKIRATIDNSEITVGKKISNAIHEKVPYLIVLGEKEIKEKVFPLRKRGEKAIKKVGAENLMAQLKKEIEDKII